MRPSREPIAHDMATAHVLDVARTRFDGPYHHHAALELTWIREGAGVRVIDGQVMPFAAGDVVLVPPQVPHVWWSRGEGEAASACVLHLMLPTALGALPELRGVSDWLDEGARPAVIEGELRAIVITELQALAKAEGLERLGRALSLLGRIAAQQEDIVRLAPSKRPADDDAPLGRVLTWIHREFAKQLTVVEGARRLSVAPASFSRAFQRRVGRPFSVYVNDVRIAEACLLLRQSSRSIAEVARRCGFPTLGHFHRQLVRRTGLGPRDYRRTFAR
ncbi:MAG: helix-turn-helix domain-containing protein [Ahniella sp.]|nr:helix-turn-helix domain-containing protein [Ahniella sp.]